MTHILFDWLIDNQLLLSSLLLSYICLERYGLKLLKATFTYTLAAIIPIALFVANLPTTMKPFQNSSIGYYLVKPNINFVDDFGLTWAHVYLFVVVALLVIALLVHQQFLRSLKLRRITGEQLQSGPITCDVYVCPSISSPMVIGVLSSKLVLPITYKEQFTNDALTLILEHESIHIRRKDNLANTVFLLSTIFVWFNPLAWFAYASFRRLQELSCDQKVLENKTKEQKVIYSKALIDCAASAPSKMMAYSHYGDKKMMLQRLSNIKQSRRSSRLAKGGILLIAACLLSSLVIAQPPAATNSAEKETAENDVVPVVRVNPTYPVHAIENGLTGAVTLQYDIAPDGTPTNIIVLSAEPERIFNREAKKALAKWKYKPSKNGYKDVLVSLEFALE